MWADLQVRLGLWVAQGSGADGLALAEQAARLSGPAVVVVVLYLVVRGHLVPAWHVEEVQRAATAAVAAAEQDRDWWREVGIQALNVGEAAVGRGGR